MTQKLACTPPMGWNSWDCYWASVTEEEVRANAAYMAEHLKPFVGNMSLSIFSGMSQEPILPGIGRSFLWKWMSIPD